MGPLFWRSAIFSKSIFWQKIKKFQSVITFFLSEVLKWPRYEKVSIFHELSKKQHRGTQKRNKNNKSNTWNFVAGASWKSNIELWHKYKVLIGQNMRYEAWNLQIYPFFCETPKEFSRKCLDWLLAKIKICTFCPIFCLENQPKMSENREFLNFAIWPKYGIHRHNISELWSFLMFFDIFECYFGVPHPTVVPRYHLRGPYWTMRKILENAVWDSGSTQIPKDHSMGHQYRYWAQKSLLWANISILYS